MKNTTTTKKHAASSPLQSMTHREIFDAFRGKAICEIQEAIDASCKGSREFLILTKIIRLSLDNSIALPVS
jgi:hypothetical protein